jgi:hypothetical protein
MVPSPTASPGARKKYHCLAKRLVARTSTGVGGLSFQTQAACRAADSGARFGSVGVAKPGPSPNRPCAAPGGHQRLQVSQSGAICDPVGWVSNGEPPRKPLPLKALKGPSIDRSPSDVTFRYWGKLNASNGQAGKQDRPTAASLDR